MLDINTVVREVGVLIRRLIGEDIELVIETTPAPLPVLGDRSQLEQVLMNLAVNARDAMPTRRPADRCGPRAATRRCS